MTVDPPATPAKLVIERLKRARKRLGLQGALCLGAFFVLGWIMLRGAATPDLSELRQLSGRATHVVHGAGRSAGFVRFTFRGQDLLVGGDFGAGLSLNERENISRMLRKGPVELSVWTPPFRSTRVVELRQGEVELVSLASYARAQRPLFFGGLLLLLGGLATCAWFLHGAGEPAADEEG